MLNSRLITVVCGLVLAVFGVVASTPLPAADVKITDPASVVMIVNRDSNDIAFMDIKTHKIIGRTFLGNNVNPHMVMMSPDGRYVVTGGTRANKAYIIDTRTLELVKIIPVDIAPEHLAFSPDGRWYYQGNPEGDSISVIDTRRDAVVGRIGVTPFRQRRRRGRSAAHRARMARRPGPRDPARTGAFA